MKYIITGSLGNISSPIVAKLVHAGHAVTVISSNNERNAQIQTAGATPAIGSVEDAAFLTKTFSGADAVYLMIPPNFSATDFFAYQQKVADNYVNAIRANGIKNIVVLSSIGAHMRKGAGPIDGLGYLEEKLAAVEGLNVLNLRPSYFYMNLLGMGGMMKAANMMGSNFGDQDEKLVLTHTKDIAEIAANHLLNLDFKGQSVAYISSDERHPNEIAAVLSQSVGKNAPWVTFSDEQALNGMLQMGVPKTMAESYAQMGKSIREGLIQADYWKSKAPVRGKIKLEDFAKEFAAVYNA